MKNTLTKPNKPNNSRSLSHYRIAKKGSHKLQLLAISIFAIAIFSCMIITVNVSGSTTPKDKLYTTVQVEEGDSLWTIANQYCSLEYSDYNEYIKEVKDINGMNNDNIKKGSYIVVPYYHN